MPPTTLRNRCFVWPWQRLWRRAADPASCERLLQELPLRLLSQPGDEPLLEWLDALRRLSCARDAALLLPNDGRDVPRQLGRMVECEQAAGCTCRDAPAWLPAAGCLTRCAGCLEAGRHRLICGIAVTGGAPGAVLLEFARAPSESQRRCLQEAGRLLGETLCMLAEQRARQRRELVAERAVLSRELHDSVAQQLSYLQIRASRIQMLIGTDEAHAQSMLTELRATLQLMHRQVRELIASARLTMDGRSLNQAIQASVDEFSRCSGCVFEVDNRIHVGLLTPEAELQVLQIIREALANVVRHSHADRAQVFLLARPNDAVEVRVEDDGIGLPEELPEDGHFGLRIMRERAGAIGARLRIDRREPCGTCVTLLWRHS